MKKSIFSEGGRYGTKKINLQLIDTFLKLLISRVLEQITALDERGEDADAGK